MITRYATAVTSGTLMTLALLFVMQFLISMEPVNDGTIVIGDLEWHPTFHEEPVKPIQDQPDFKKITEYIEPAPRPDPGFDPEGGTGVWVPTDPPTPGGNGPKFKPGISDGPLVAMIRVAPVYPTRATSDGLEGYVIVEFDVMPDGSTANIRVIESSHRVFERSAMNAAKKFRYKARVVNGEPLATQGVRNKFTYEIERG